MAEGGVHQARKLGLRPGHRVCLVASPAGWALEDPEAATPVETADDADVVIFFVRSAAELEARLGDLAGRIHPDRALWIAWPRRAAGHHSDVDGNVVREVALPLGVVDNKVAAIDHDWSGLRLVWRLSHR